MPKYGSVETSSSSSGPMRRVVSNANFLVELFDGSDHFGMWEQKYGYKNETSTSKMWKALEEKFLKKSSQNRLHIKKRLFRFDYQPSTSMNEHINAFNELVADLLGMDETFKDEDLALMLFSSLSDEFEHLETTLLHGKDNVTLKDVTAALYSYELRKKTKKESKYEVAEAMVARGHSKSQKPKWRGRSKLKSRLGKDECVFCHEKCHWKKDCPKLKKKGKAAPDACVAEHDANDSDISLVASSTTFHSDECILDSVSTYHMSPNREWFSNLVELNVGVIYMGNDNACKTVGIGSIRLKNQDGSTRVLKDVRYGIRKNNLYYYQCSTIIGAVAAASRCDDLDATQLWHMRLGHAGEKSLQILEKKGLLKERMNRTLLEKVRCMLSNAGLAKTFWVETVTYAGHLINRLPSSAIEGKIPLEVWSGKPTTDYDSLHVFGSTAYYHVKESKLDPRAKKVLFMGITHGVKGFRIWCLNIKKIICSRDVTFDESTLVKKVEFQQMMIPKVDASDSSTPIEESENEEVQTQEPLETPEPLAVTRPRREIRRPARFVDMVAYSLPVVDDDIPITYQEAIQSLESDKWKSVMDEEMQSLQKNNTWKLAQLPKGKRAIGCKWVIPKKDVPHSKKDVRYKVRLVAKGYAQKEGINYNEVFSLVVKHSSIRILLALVAQLNLELAQLDVKTDFLHGDLEEEIYMTQLEGYKDGGCEKWVCKLNKLLYGLKQSPRQWYKLFDSFMRRQKYTRSKYDHCVYLQKLKDGSFIYLLLYVDDMLIASNSQNEIDKLKTQLNQEFEMKDLGEAKKILEGEYMAKVPYANAVGSLMYAMVCTRPDISQAVGVDEALGQCVVGYVDSDYAGDLDKRRSTTGYLFTLAKAPVSWKSTLQSTVALSTQRQNTWQFQKLWSLIAGRLPGRTDNEVKNYWNSHIKRKLIKMGNDPNHHKLNQYSVRLQPDQLVVPPDNVSMNVACKLRISSTDNDGVSDAASYLEDEAPAGVSNLDLDLTISFPSAPEDASRATRAAAGRVAAGNRFNRFSTGSDRFDRSEPVQETLRIVRQLDPTLLDQLNHVYQYSPVRNCSSVVKPAISRFVI
ncbi:hypothetical protein F3Y22_tig00117034pilonHSYRG00285 [Hibiscus syriacus]|uniref:Uncharacterized protein n=1 Tax=Hibiscus syriacus TaxID=106335 RepID=A0A6A2WZ50_HIBSY|nr:hypothetical protein F3Y22_tig00117034pilonHSYRG00285 [Hibiscus syriacus]